MLGRAYGAGQLRAASGQQAAGPVPSWGGVAFAAREHSFLPSLSPATVTSACVRAPELSLCKA